MNPRHILIGAGLALLACGRTPDRPVAAGTGAPVTRTDGPSSLVRLARAGARARLYAMPTLEEAGWQSSAALPAIDTLIGVDYEQHLIFALDRKRNVFALDLPSGRTRTYLGQATTAALGPDMSLYVVDTGRSVVQLARRTPTPLRGRVRGTPAGLFGTMSGDLLVIQPGARSIEVISGSAARTLAVPAGIVTATFWGDLIAVGTDTGIVLMDPQSRRQPAVVSIGSRALALLFSPSGHRLYAAGTGPEVIVLDRFSRSVQRRIRLPGTARALRSDFFGNWLLVRPLQGDSVWVVDVNTDRLVATVAGGWASDLPAISGSHGLAVRRGKDVVSVDLTHPAQDAGRVAGGAADLWIPVVWAPPLAAEPAVEATADTARVSSVPSVPAAGSDVARTDTSTATRAPSQADSAAAAAGKSVPHSGALYLQVSSSRNPTWATDLAAKLRAAGLAPSVLKPAGADESYRVVLGPYPTRDAADEAGRKLGMPSFVITVQSDSAP